MTETSLEVNGPAADQRRSRIGARDLLKALAATLLIYVVIHAAVAQPFEVKQDSMTPTILDGDYVLVDKLTPLWEPYRRGDIVVFMAPEDAVDGGVPFIKRIIGLPGDVIRIDAGAVVVLPPGGDEIRLTEPYTAAAGVTLPSAPGLAEWRVPEGTYFVLGDNRGFSLDSRTFGPIDGDAVLGRAWIRYYPLDRLSVLAPSGSVRAMSSE